MTTQAPCDRTEVIARLNDRARLGLDSAARIVFTRTCLATFCDPDSVAAVVIQAELMAAFRRAVFTDDCPERDFASLEYRGQKVWLKIDYYDSTMEFGSDNPADASITTRVITILLPSDY